MNNKLFGTIFPFKSLFMRNVSYNFEMPEGVQKSFYLANAQLCENINWFYYRSVEVAFDRFVRQIKHVSPSSKDADIVRNVLNKVSMLKLCNYVSEINFPVMKDSGKTEMVKMYIAKHGMHYPTHLGGLRISNDLEKAHLKALATLGSFKNICVDVPFAGSYAGIKIDLKEYSQQEMQRLICTFTRIIEEKHLFGPQVNILYPELTYSEDIINSIVKNLKEKYSNSEVNLSFITGKSISNGGLLNYNNSEVDGIIYGVENILNNKEIMGKLELSTGWKDKTYIIKGAGKLGMNLAKILNEKGSKCIGISDTNCSYYNPDGINIEEAMQHKENFGSLENYFPPYNAKKFLTECSDLMIVTDSFRCIDCYIAPQIRVKILVEAINSALTPTAHKILTAKKILVIPDIYINSGTTIASHVEYVKNMDSSLDVLERKSKKNLLLYNDYKLPYLTQSDPVIQYYPELEEADKDEQESILKTAIEIRLNNSAQKILKMLKVYNLEFDIRTAAYIIATEKIFELLQNSRYL